MVIQKALLLTLNASHAQELNTEKSSQRCMGFVVNRDAATTYISSALNTHL